MRRSYLFGIRGRLLPSVLLLVILSMWLLGLALMDLTQSAAKVQFSARARTIAAAVEHLLETGRRGAAPRERAAPDRRLRPLLTAMAGDPDIEEVVVFDGDGSELESSAPPGGRAETAVAGKERAGGFEFSFPLLLGPGRKGTVEVRFSRSGLQRHLTLSLVRIIVQLAITSLVLIVFINILTGLTVLSPLRRLLSATERIGEGDLGLRVEADGRDELGDLARSFNAMLERLRVSEQNNRLQLESLRLAHGDLKAKESQLVQSEKMAAVGRVAAGVAHEVGNPLGSVTGYLAMLRDESLSVEERADYLQRTEREIARINRIMLDLLNYTRPPRVEWSTVDVSLLLRDIVRLLTSQEDFSGIDFSFELPEGLPRVRGDLHLMQQMFINIMLNASQAMPEGGAITLRSFRLGESDGVGVTVADGGPGIPPGDLPHIFEPFFTSRKGSRGTGLGLALCRRIADSLGAGLDVDSRPGEGATFTVTFPARGGASEESHG